MNISTKTNNMSTTLLNNCGQLLRRNFFKIFIATIALLMGGESWGQGTLSSPVFSENFGTIANATALTTTNTAFSYIRVGTGTGGSVTNRINALTPSSFTSSSAIIGANTGSISTIDKTGLTSFSSGAFTFKVKTPASLTSAVLLSAVGTGATFGSATVFTGAQLSAAFQISGTNLQIRSNGAWTTVQTVATSTTYTITVVFNNTGSTIYYGASNSLATNKVDIWVNGTLAGSAYTSATASLAASAFRIYAQTGEFEVDDVAVYSTMPTSNDATLSALSLSSGSLSPIFSSTTYNYTTSVISSASSITVTPTTTASNAGIQVKVNAGNFAAVTSGSASSSLSLNVGKDTVVLKVTAQNTTTIIYDTIFVTRATPVSSDANLSGLTISSGTLSPSFSSTTYNYAASVTNATSSVTITPTVNQANATIQLKLNTGSFGAVTSGSATSALSLNVGKDTIVLQVTAQDATTIIYDTVFVTRAASADASLSALSISTGTLSPVFASATYAYAASVSNATASVTVTPTRNESNAAIQVRVNSGSYASVTSGTASGLLSLNVGSNTIDVKVTAQDGSTILTYTTTVTRAGSADASLSALSISTGTLSPVFASATYAYAASVSNATASITVTPTRNQANASIQVRVNSGSYVSVTSGNASGSLSLNVGDNTIDIKVTAQDGTTTNTYTTTVTRAASADATLSALTISAGSLSPSFAAGTNSYSASVTNATTSVTVTPTRNEANATIQVQVNSGGYSSVSSATASGALSLSVGGNTIDVKVTAQDGTTINTYTITVTVVVPSSPVISTTGSFSALSTQYGTESSPSSISVSGEALTDDILVTAPAGFEVSKTSGTTGFAATQTLIQSSNTVNATTIYLRLAAATAVGSYSGNVVLSSTDATTVNVATVSSSVSPKGLTISGISGVDKIYNGNNTASITGTATLNGLVGLDDVTLNGTSASFLFADATVGTGKAITASGYTITGTAIGNYTLAQPTGLTASITKADQSITFAATNTKTFGNADYAPGATSATSGVNAITYTSSNSAVATIVSNQIHIVGAGVTTITATQAASTNYNTVSVAQTLTVNQATQTITALPTPVTKTYGDVPYSAATSATSGLVVTYSSSDPLVASVASNGIVTILKAGTTTITASQSGNANYSAASDVSQALTVNKAAQSITFASTATKVLNAADYNPGATSATSGVNAITYESSDLSVASIVAGNIHIVGLGETTITASQAASTNYNAANATQTLTVNPTPVITSSQSTLAAFSTIAGTASTPQAFTISGANLTDNILVTAPTGYEVAQTSAPTTFAATQTVTQTSGSASTTIYM